MANAIRKVVHLLLLPLLAGCTRQLFQPMEQHLLDPADYGIIARDIYFRTDDGVRLHGWFLPARTPEPHGTVLFLHGNAENISTHIGSVYWMPEHGYNVFLFDYRGYGRSEGSPSLAGLQLDFAAALRTVFTNEAVDRDRVAVFGQSLGAATAITGLADSPFRRRIRALIVEGAMTSYREVAREKLAEFWLTWPLQWPLSLTISDRLRPIDVIDRIAPVPLLIVHSRDDAIIGVHHAKELYSAAEEPKKLWLVDEVPHIAAFTVGEERKRLVNYLDERMETD